MEMEHQPVRCGPSRDLRHEKVGKEKRKRISVRFDADLHTGIGFRKFSETPGQTPKKAYVLKEFTSTSCVGICSTRCLVTPQCTSYGYFPRTGRCTASNLVHSQRNDLTLFDVDVTDGRAFYSQPPLPPGCN
ncbi:unnamed protein product [Cyprideis torosa]|uniref:Apple domain-containing protein n=1 Tax=Cyprideis torosa TaxID=163714 RepID=A0A7R8WQ16_9CRUS|nr:unnamed protein product [Cyprideis torosa]CAG0902201.1 unnamed protein product [Cyprideis torosa]